MSMCLEALFPEKKLITYLVLMSLSFLIYYITNMSSLSKVIYSGLVDVRLYSFLNSYPSSKCSLKINNWNKYLTHFCLDRHLAYQFCTVCSPISLTYQRLPQIVWCWVIGRRKSSSWELWTSFQSWNCPIMNAVRQSNPCACVRRSYLW